MIVYEDEASFRQTPTLYRTWARRGCQPQIPTRGERSTQKVLGAVSVPDGRFVWRHQTQYFNAATYLSFLENALLPQFYRRRHRVFLIQDNASSHKKPEVWDWFRQHRRQVEVFLLPSYSPELNATERASTTPASPAHTTDTSRTPPRWADRSSPRSPTCRRTQKPSNALWLRFNDLVCCFIYTRTYSCSEHCVLGHLVHARFAPAFASLVAYSSVNAA